MGWVREVHVLDVHPLDVHVLGGSCSKCRNRKSGEENQGSGSKRRNSSSDFSNIISGGRDMKTPYTYLYPPNDVWMSNSGAVSVGHKILGSKCIGQKSPLIGDNSVLDNRGNFIGRTFEAGGRTYLDRKCW